MANAWERTDLFPIIAQVIISQHEAKRGYVTHDEIVAALLRDPDGSTAVDRALGQSDLDHSREWLAANMVAWFSQRITVGDSEWSEQFDRKHIDGKWAYRPAAK